MSCTEFRNATTVTRPQSTPSAGDTCGARGNNSSIRRRGLRLALLRTSSREGEGLAHTDKTMFGPTARRRVSEVRCIYQIARAQLNRDGWVITRSLNIEHVIRAPQSKADQEPATSALDRTGCELDEHAKKRPAM